MQFVEVSVNVPRLRGLFTYHLPPELEQAVQPGCLVEVPFGQQAAQGIVLRRLDRSEIHPTRPVSGLIDPQPVLTPLQMRLAHWMADRLLEPLPACLDSLLPAGLAQRAETRCRLAPPKELNLGQIPAGLGPQQSRLWQLLSQRGPLRSGQIDHALGSGRWRAAAQSLEKRGLLISERYLPPPAVRAKLVRTARLGVAPALAEAALPTVARAGTQALLRRQAVLRLLVREPWEVDLPWIYAQTGAQWVDIQALVEKGLLILGESEIWRDPLAELAAEPDAAPELTPEQEQAWQALRQGLACLEHGEVPAPYLLHGVTGSGKTEVYMRAIQETLARGRQAVVLVPEIALTPQTVRRLAARFPGQVGLLHSRLTEGERYDTWRRARAGKLGVVVGPRSALLQAPLPNLGLVVVDECHDDSYYQGEHPPFYHAVPAAAALARMARALCIFGSATPDLVAHFQAESGRWQRLELPSRVWAGAGAGETPRLPPVQVVDMRQELKAGNRSMFSRALQAALRQTLQDGHQAILFLNRRGTATYVFCRECGFSLRCPNCQIPLTYHTDSRRLLCHYCNHGERLPADCPQCHSASIRQFGAGTEKVEHELRQLLPAARVLRWDADTARQKNAHSLIMAHFANRQADVLVGTQMLAKGLDLPNVTLVGVVLADVGLNLPDYRANERTFQVLTQVAGRAGRSALGGRVIFQTFLPDHYVIQAAAEHNTAVFYRQELAYRRQLNYPPFTRLARLELRGRTAEEVEAGARRAAEELQAWLEQAGRASTRLIGPVPCFFGQINGVHRWQVVLSGPDPAGLLRGLPEPLRSRLTGWRIEIDPPSLL